MPLAAKSRSSASRSTSSRSSSHVLFAELEDEAAWKAARPAVRKRQTDRNMAISNYLPTLLWSLTNEVASIETAALIAELSKASHGARQVAAHENPLAPWLATLPGRAPSAALGLECVAWTFALAKFAELLPAERLREALTLLVTTAKDAAALDEKSPPLAWQLLAGELPLVLAHLFSDLEDCRRLAEPASAMISAGLDLLLDGEGMPHAARLDVCRPLLALWTRCLRLMRLMGQADLSPEAQEQFDWAVRQAARLSRSDGSQLLSTGPSGAYSEPLFQAALELCSSPTTQQVVRRLLDRDPGPAPPDWEPSEHSAWSGVSLLRSRSTDESPRLLAAYDDRHMRCELAVEGRSLLLGEWTLSLEIDGRPLAFTPDWQEVCWHLDEEVVYLELETKAPGGWRVQRQMALARKANWLLLADAVLGEGPASIQYESSLALAPSARLEPEAETCDAVLLAGQRRLAAMLPLALTEWRSACRHGSLESDGSQAILRQRATGQRLFAPLFIDLDRRRVRQERTWRHLTVAEDLQILPPDMAVGYRAQSGKDQWLVYRSLGPSGNRTVLGQNRVSEFFVLSLLGRGKVEVVVEVESTEEP